ncbi:FRAS1-related extracellular matrix protein 3 [Gracilinanus agilis]|uniref:FRAS1-related extracellular matrix protein 3 n=1 Tax=Gracilinanus agilis TaxID=191870 RepID=UPI001CFE6673|nr:FRAS1-related extracellular matrix protein 3 [Gracilinanus agilis]
MPPKCGVLEKGWIPEFVLLPGGTAVDSNGSVTRAIWEEPEPRLPTWLSEQLRIPAALQRDMTRAWHRPQGTPHQLLAAFEALLLCCLALKAQMPEPKLSVSGPTLGTGSHNHSSKGAGILAAPPGLRVPLGRSVWLDPVRNLAIRVQPGDRCMVMVLGKDGGRVAAVSPPLGALSPASFPCAFGQAQVRYTHFGARSPAQQQLRLQLRYDSQSQTLVLPFTMPVDVDFSQPEVVTRNLPLIVEKLRGFSNAIDQTVLNFSTASLTASSLNGVPLACRLTPLPRESGPLPRYGRLVGPSGASLPPGRGMDCQTFLTAGIYYQHMTTAPSPNRDYVPFLVEIVGPEEERDIRLPRILAQEHFQMLVRIQEGTENSPPRPSFGAMMMMEVDQFVLTALTLESLAAEDLESSPDDLIFNILNSSPALPESHGQQGYFINTDNPLGQPITSFTQQDLRELKIAYQPPTDDSNQERLFQLELEVVDVDGAVSDPFAFMVVVKPMNTLAPVASRNQGLLLFEGQSRPLSSAQSLEISDEDNLEEVRVTIMKGLKHGQLVVLGAPAERKYFTSADLAAERVIYQHDGSDTYSDNIIFRMGDGQHDVEFFFSITIAPEDDEPPVVNTNTGLSLAEGEVVQISHFELSATDIDSEDSTIRFVLKRPALENEEKERGWDLASTSTLTMQHLGEVLLRQSEPPSPLMGERGKDWTFVEKEGLYEKVVTEWLQQDILDGRLFYRHLGLHHPSSMLDQLVFHVQDDHDPPNQSGQHFFTIKVQPVDVLSPELYPGVSLEMIVKEYQLTPFQKEFLCYTDLDSDDWHLRYTLLTPPTDIDNNHPVPAGEIVLMDAPTIPITQFTQAQVNHHKVAYQPPQQELGIAPRVVQFTYRVVDAAGNSVPGTFNLFLKPMNNQPPEVTNSGFTVEEGKNFILTNRELGVIDLDTDADKIVFTLAQGPQHGHLLYLEGVMASGTYFMSDDIVNGHVSYQHGGGETTNDAFQLVVSDRVHQVPITVRVTVKTVEDGITVPEGGWVGTSIEVLENGATKMTTGIIQGKDKDTDILMLTFLVEKPPKLGIILVNGLPTEQFTQGDLINGAVAYAHTGGEIGMQKQHDAFKLTISNHSDLWLVEGKIVEGVQVQVTVLPIDSVPPEMKVGELFSVPEGGKSTLTLRHLDTKDVDTPHNDILCTIIGQPSFGYLENNSPAPGSEKSQAGSPISAFTIKDICQGHINFVQSIHKGVEPREDQFTFHCSDGINFSPNHIFPIIILPTNDEQPELFTHEFVVLEGMSLVIDTPLLNSADADLPPDELQFQVTVLPQNGQIVQQLATGSRPVHSFTLEEIQEASTIVYEHDDSETTEDSFEIWVTDGKHIIHRKIPIAVILVDDETPRLIINDGLEVDTGQTKVITNHALKATDLDSNDKDLAYILRSEPGQGLLQKLLEPRGRVGSNLTLGMNFTQSEIDQGLICYSHKGLEGVRDLIRFDVTDGINPLIDRSFYVTISSTDKVFPEVINKGVTLKEGARVILTTDLLSTSDINSPDEQLHFSITRAPTRGHLESSDLPEEPISSFTQLQLAGNKISYVHTAEDEVKMDKFEFKVSDGHNSILRTFHVSITDVDNKKPILTIHHLLVCEGEKKLITPFELSAEDQDSPDGLLRFTITHFPIHGQILYNGSQPITSFTKQDLNENLISYRHDGTETTEDSFSFIVTDGTHTDFYIFPDTVLATHKPQVMKIQISSLDNGVPQIVVNKGAPALRLLQTGHLGFLITSKSLKAKDQDSPHKLLKYAVISGPKHGSLIHLGLGNGNIKMFTQADIDEMKVCYVLKEGSNATSDIFYFSVEDTESTVYIPEPEYRIEEDAGEFLIPIRRSGDVSQELMVFCSTHQGTASGTIPSTVLSYSDYISRPEDHNSIILFDKNKTEETCRVIIIDDSLYEEEETFSVTLSMPMGGQVGVSYPSTKVVILKDADDEPVLYFGNTEYSVDESAGSVEVGVWRKGTDLSKPATVTIQTKKTEPVSAEAGMDYVGVSQSLDFAPGVNVKTFRVTILDDLGQPALEGPEKFELVLRMPMGSVVGEPSTATIIINDTITDLPTVQFKKPSYTGNEKDGQVRAVIYRNGDISHSSTVRCYTRQGSAQVDVDYKERPNTDDSIVTFLPGKNSGFTLIPEITQSSCCFGTKINKAIVYIEEMDSLADVTFPAIPQVVSLLMYDDTSAAIEKSSPPTGYPVVCVTACNPKYSDYDKTGSICIAESINDTLTLYRWLVGAPTSNNGATSLMQEVNANTFFTNTKSIALDSLYFQAGSRVQCAARAVSINGDVGLELLSSIITISQDDGFCQPYMPGTVGAKPFSAKIHYTGPDDPDYPNLIKLTVMMPHLDGMLPVISTQPLSNFELTLSPDGTRVGNHKCSNLLDSSEIQTKHGFITEYSRSTDGIREALPYQDNASLRSAQTLRFYHNLNLDACLWEFNSYYDMSELLTACGGSVGTDGQVLNLVQSYVTLRVPLFVSYVFHSPGATGGWKHFDLQSELRLTFVYDTSILWKEGIGSLPESELHGTLHPISMRIDEEGRLVVNFQTEIQFQGQLVMSHPGTTLSSMVMSMDHPGLTFTLSLLRSEPTFHQPEQRWSFVSGFAIRDYSGTYTIKLIPCVAAPQQKYSLPMICHPREPIAFDLVVRFQQVSDPVAMEFSLNTRMFLLSKKELWISNDSMGFGEGSDVAFSEGSTIYGRVMVDPVQNLGDAFTCNIEQVFLCTGVDGYVPKYSPENKAYGCLADSSSLLYRFKILDRAQPETQARRFRNVSFNAHLATDRADAIPLVKQPGSDGFSLSSAALFQVAAGREWYLHAVYTVRSRESTKKGIGRRSTEQNHMPALARGPGTALSLNRSRRAASDAPTLALDIGADDSRGTDIQRVALVRSIAAALGHEDPLPPGTQGQQPELDTAEAKMHSGAGPMLGAGGGLLLLSCTALVAVFLLRHRKRGPLGKDVPGSRKTPTIQHSSSEV